MMPVRLWDQEGQKVWEGNSDARGHCQPDTLNHGIHQPLRLPGQFEDELTGSVQNRYRDYDPAIGRYLTPDPIGLHGGLNSYRYTQNPVDYIDPLGLCDEQEAQKGVFASLKDGVLNTLAWVDEKTTIPALADLQTSMLDGLDEMGARAHASGNSWAVPLLGVTYAATYTLMPTSALDVVPVGKVAKLGKHADVSPSSIPPVRNRVPAQKTVHRFGDVTDFNRAANKPQPNTRYEYGTYSWETDNIGRVTEASGKVKLNPIDGRAGTDGIGTKLIGREGVDGDIGFHLIGDQFGGATNRLNVVPGNGKRVDPSGPPNLNQGQYAKFERSVKNAVKDPANAGKDVEIRVSPQYRRSNTTNRPDQFEASYRVEGGEWETFMFKNQQGG